MIGLQFYTDKVIQALIKELPDPRWSKQFALVYIINTKENLNKVYKKFRGIAFINGNSFLERKYYQIMSPPVLIGIETELKQLLINMCQKNIF